MDTRKYNDDIMAFVFVVPANALFKIKRIYQFLSEKRLNGLPVENGMFSTELNQGDRP